EVRQDCGVLPPFASHGGPLVEVSRRPTRPDQAVDRAGTAQHPATNPRVRYTAARCIGLSAVAPRVGGAGLEHAGGDVDEGAGVSTSGLEQQHPGARILREPIGQDTAGGAGSDDDVVPVGHGLAANVTGSRRGRWKMWYETFSYS